MKKTLSFLRLTAKILLVFTPVMIFSGFLTAKPFLIESLGFSTGRWIHTVLAPAVFVPLLVAHSSLGILFLLQRSSRFKNSSMRYVFTGAWAIFLLLLTSLYFVVTPPEENLDELEPPIEEVSSTDEDAGDDTLPETQETADSKNSDRTKTDAEIEPDADEETDMVRADGDADQVREKVTKAPTINRRPKRAVAERRQKTKTVAKTKTKSPEKAENVAKAPEKRISGFEVVRRECAKCHPMGVVTKEKRTAGQWRSVLNRMIGLGAKVSPEERGPVLSYLISRYGKKAVKQ